jgi:hypothetical protein
LPSKFGGAFSYDLPHLRHPSGIVFLGTLGTLCHFSVGHYLFAFLLFSFLYFCIFVVLCIKFNKMIDMTYIIAVDYISLVCFNFD